MSFDWIKTLSPWGLAGVVIGLMAVGWVQPTTGYGSILLIFIVFSLVTLFGCIFSLIIKKLKEKSTIVDKLKVHKESENESKPKADFNREPKPSSSESDSISIDDK